MSASARTPAAALECAGAPRDIGATQGAAHRGALARAFAREPGSVRIRHRLGRLDPIGRDLDREIRRHFPHQHETVSQLARAAGVPRGWLMAQLAATLEAAVASPRELLAVEGPEESWLAGGIPTGSFVRRSRPDGCFASVELALPWLAAARAGVNEAGLAVVARVETASPKSRRVVGPPALLLAQDCLERFGSVEAGLDWCTGRPGVGYGSLLLADAGGEVAGVCWSGRERRVLRPRDQLLVRTDADPNTLSKLADRVRAGGRDPSALMAENECGREAAWLVLCPRNRRLEILADAGKLRRSYAIAGDSQLAPPA